MWDITLRILSVIGVILLILFGLLLFCLLLFLFCPVRYRLEGKKTPEELRIFAGASWLFGLLRLRYSYPESGTLTVRVLWKTIFDSSRRKEQPEEEEAGAEKQKKEGAGRKEDADKEQAAAEKNMETALAEGAEKPSAEALLDGKSSAETAGAETDPKRNGSSDGAEKPSAEALPDGKSPSDQTSEEGADSPDPEEKTGISGKIEKIKYTIRKNCDKIKEIWANLSYYTQLLQEENTAQLWRHILLRLTKILKSIRPRHIRAELLFGAASPDTTGYLYGIYCMFSPALGEKVIVRPDFTQAILQGEAEIFGRITGCVLIGNGLKLLLDRKLHLFLKKIKAGRKRDGR